MSAPTPPPGPAAPATAAPALYTGTVRHVRREPVANAFGYGTTTWLVDVDDLPRLPWPLRPLARWHAHDHFGQLRPRRGGPGAHPTLRGGVEATLARHGVPVPDGPILMLGQPRVLGYVFNPLTVFWCLDRHGTPRVAVAEVHNTYRGRHAYVLPVDGSTHWQGVPKQMYVSPFNDVEGSYRLSLPVPGERLDLVVVLEREGRPPFTATLTGRRREVTWRSVLAAALRHPVAPLLGAAQIRVQAIGLMLRGLRLRPRPGTAPGPSTLVDLTAGAPASPTSPSTPTDPAGDPR